MNSTTSRRRRYSARAAAVATTAAVIFGAAACGSETASDNGEPAAPAAPPAKVQTVPHQPMSADAAERWAATERSAAAHVQEQYLAHLLRAAKQHDQMELRRQQSEHTTGHWRDIPLR
jgi:hypothetical protein